MKRIFGILTIGMILNTVQGQTKKDLEKIPYHTPVKEFVSGKEAYAVTREDWTSLPAQVTESVQGFSFGPVSLTNGGESGPKDIPATRASFLFSDGNHTRAVGLVLQVAKAAESKKLRAYITGKYGKGSSFDAPNPHGVDRDKVNGYAAVLYKLTKSNQSMIVVDNFPWKGEKHVYTLDVYIVDNDVKVTDKGNNDTVVEMIKKINKRN